MNRMTQKTMIIRCLIFLESLFMLGAISLLPSTRGVLRVEEGIPDGTMPFTIEPLSLLIGVGVGGLVVGIPLLLWHKHSWNIATTQPRSDPAAAGREYNKSSSTVGVAGNGGAEGTTSKQTPKDKPKEKPPKEFKGHVTLLK